MGLQWGHGREAVDWWRPNVYVRPSARFNGATAARPWMVDMDEGTLLTTGLQWGHGREAVDGDLCGLRRRRLWLQWGHGREAVDGRQCRGGGLPGPARFNGATAARPWMAWPRRRSPDRIPRFNGATAARPWMDYALVAAMRILARLQWGHGREAVDGMHRRPQRGQLLASMGPRPRGRGWPLTNPKGGVTVGASMGPRPRGRGLVAAQRVRPSLCTLQWGHGREAVDGRRLRCRRPQRARASMGPRPRGRGWFSISMPLTKGLSLQWGHGREAVMESRQGVSLPSEMQLQWGHGREAVDGGHLDAHVASMGTSFNGATAARPWMASTISPRNCQRPTRFNGATAARPWMV